MIPPLTVKIPQQFSHRSVYLDSSAPIASSLLSVSRPGAPPTQINIYIDFNNRTRTCCTILSYLVLCREQIEVLTAVSLQPAQSAGDQMVVSTAGGNGMAALAPDDLASLMAALAVLFEVDAELWLEESVRYPILGQVSYIFNCITNFFILTCFQNVRLYFFRAVIPRVYRTM